MQEVFTGGHTSEEFIGQPPPDYWGAVINATLAAYADAPTEVYTSDGVTTVIRNIGQESLSFCYIDSNDNPQVEDAITQFASLLNEKNITGGVMFRNPPNEEIYRAASEFGFTNRAEVPHMVRPLTSLFPIDEGVEIEHADTLELLNESAEAQALAFKTTPEVINLLKGPKVLENKSVRTYNLRNDDGRVVSTTMAVNTANISTILLMATLPEFQGKGYGSTLLKSVLNISRQEGGEHANLRSTNAGKLLYTSIGFQTTETHTTLSNKKLL